MAFLPLLAAFGIGTALTTATNPLLELVNQELNKVIPVKKAAPNELVMMRYKEDITEEKYLELMLTYGLDEEQSQNIFSGNRTLIDTTQAIIMFRRGLFASDEKENEQKFYDIMQNNGIDVATAKDMITSTQQFETVNQVFLWLVREVFDPEKRKELQLDSEFPEAALGFAKKLGIPESTMRDGWAGHWILATPEQMAEVMHRYHPDDKKFWSDEVEEVGLDPDEVSTDINDIKNILKFADVGPAYRERIAAISFNNLGRIETRWMIRFRTVELEEATYLYKRLGLTATMAKRVAQTVFVTQSITDWKDGIRLGATTWEDVQTELGEWQVTEQRLLDVVQRKVAPEMVEGVKDEREFTKSMTRDFYLNNVIDREKSLELLNNINYGDFQRKLIIERWDIEKQKRESGKSKTARTLSKTDIKQRFVKGLIDATMAKSELKEKGYVGEDADKLIKLWVLIKEGTKV